ncbi:MAG: IPT/TIG domain-containing protein [Desulfosalsimonadaceae bacterium]
MKLPNTQLRLVLLSFLVLFLFGCSGGGGGGGGSDEENETGAGGVFVDWQENAAIVNGQVNLPASSPLAMSEIEVDVYETSTTPDGSGKLTFKSPAGQIAEAYIMLPERKGESLPTIYLYTTILPGETDIVFSAEETAVSLLMSRISQQYLLDAGTPAQVKNIIRNNGAAFINAFAAKLQADPYTLRTGNLENVYTPAFETAADDCRDALMLAASGNSRDMLISAAAASSSNGSQLYVSPPGQIQHDFIVYEDTTGLLGLDTWADLEDSGGTITGQLKIENDTMLFAHYQIHDLLTGSELTSLSVGSGIPGMIGVAFHPDILGPQKGWTRLWWAGTARKAVEYKSTKVAVLTPKLAFGDTATEIEKQIGGGLAFRTGATALMTVVSNFVPIDEDGWKNWFVEMNDRGLLNAAFDQFAYGNIQGGVEVLFWTFCDGTLMESFIKDYVAKYLKKGLDANKITSQFMNKFNMVVKQVPIAKIGLAVDIVKLIDDYNLIPGRIVFNRVEFPLNLTDAAPNPITKVGPNEPLPRITITGMGLSDVLYNGDIYSPQVYLEAEDAKGKEKIFNIDEKDVFSSANGESLWFDLPREWAEIGSNIVGPIYLNVVHRFVDEHGVDELITLELPHEDHEELFALNFESAVVITNVTEPKPTLGEEITLIGQGFSPISSDNGVYFNDHTGASIAAKVFLATSTTLEVILPNGLDFGPLTVEVELNDGSQSNKFPLSLHPKPVLADTEDGTHFADTLEVAFMQEEDCDIYYTINNGGDKKFTGAPVTISATSHLYPYAKVTVDGVDYLSVVSDFFYYKCSETEDLVNGTCVDSIPQDSDAWVLEKSAPFSDCESNINVADWFTDFNPGFWQRSYKTTGGVSGITGKGTYTVPPSVLKPGEGPTFSTSVTTTTVNDEAYFVATETHTTQIWALTFNKYPLDSNGKLNLANVSPVWHSVFVKAQSIGNDSASAQETLILPKKGWVGWGEYVVLQTSGGQLSPISGCEMGYNYVYRWKE